MVRHFQVQRTDDIESISTTVYEDLTQKNWVVSWNAIAEPNFILTDSILKVPVRCFCGDPLVSLSYGLFATYVVVAGDNPSTVATTFNTTEAVVMRYNPSVNWNSSSSTAQYAFIPVTGNPHLSLHFHQFDITYKLHKHENWRILVTS